MQNNQPQPSQQQQFTKPLLLKSKLFVFHSYTVPLEKFRQS
ncbi:hypothetical protein [Listeria valentina]|nr:hypothetical protein [Listeria valentina]